MKNMPAAGIRLRCTILENFVRHRKLLGDRSVALCCQTVFCPVCPVCLWRWCTVAKRLDESRWNLACR